MSDQKNGPIIQSRPVVRLEVKLGSGIGLDPKQRMVIFEAGSDLLLERYQVGIPAAVLKAVCGDLIAREAENEAQALKGNVGKPKLTLIQPQ